MEDVLLPRDIDRVPGVVSALRSHHDIGLVRENIDNLAFALVTPLGAYQNCVGHNVFCVFSLSLRERAGIRRHNAFPSLQ